MNTKLDRILAEISAGELIDKITILEIKKIKIADKNKLLEIDKELLTLNLTLKNAIPDLTKIIKFNFIKIINSNISRFIFCPIVISSFKNNKSFITFF